MQTPNFSRYEFIDQDVLNASFLGPYNNFLIQNAAFISPGGVNWSYLTAVPTLLVVTVTAPAPFGVQFNSGVFSQAHGITDGVDTNVYSLNFASFVPGSGSATVYAVASAAQVNESPLQVVGPPPGHPDYDPTFTPTTDYTITYDTLNIYVTSTAPNNTSVIELFRTILTAGQTSIAPGNIDYSHQVTAYVTAPVTSVFGRTQAVVASAADYASYYGQLAVNNTWTATNTFALTSGAAGNSPNLVLQGWTGSAAINNYIYTDSNGVFHLRNSTNAADIFTVDQSGNTRAYATFFANSNITGAGTLGISGITSLGSSLNLTGAGIFASTLGVSGATTLGNTLNLTGAGTFASTLGVSGATTLGNTLNLTGAGTFASTLGVSGNVTIGGSIVTTGIGNFNTSALDFKENVQDIVLDVPNFMKLRPISYTHIPSHLPTTGFAAAEVYEIYPELVQLQEGKPYALNYVGIIPYIVSIVKCHEAKIRDFEIRLAGIQ